MTKKARSKTAAAIRKLHALGHLSAAIAHEINNPLAGVIVYSQLLLKKLKSGTFYPEEAADILSRMESSFTRSRLVRSLRPDSDEALDPHFLLSGNLEKGIWWEAIVRS